MSTTPGHGNPSPPAQCLVAAGLQDRILSPPDAGFAERTQSYWCNSAKLRPACIIQPHFVSEVATAVKANNIDDGVTINLGLSKNTRYDAASAMTHIGPGAK
ncbi:hypothetical protein F5Y01DRAFT_315885 [Xylaria sp. FL0043]|nr:hypothetical protein F5Y01DRAFT_315885 [Xylaria sp. FL0043]